ncbi:MAG: potassium-transporting ATPase subunit KdpA [Nitrososphaeria archaeon]
MNIAIYSYIVWFIYTYAISIILSYFLALAMYRIFFDLKPNSFFLRAFKWDMLANEYFFSLVLVNLFSAVIAFVILWYGYITSHNNFLWFNIITSYITNTNLQHFINQQLPYLVQTTGLMYLQFVAPATGLSVAVAIFRSLFYKKFGNFYVDFLNSVLFLAATVFVITILYDFFGVAFGFPFSYLQGIKDAPLSIYNTITLLGNNGGSYITEGIAEGALMPNSITAFLDIIVLNLLPFSLIFLIGKITKNIKLSISIFLVVLIFYFAFNLILLENLYPLFNKSMPAALGDYASLSLFYSSIATNTGASVFILKLLSPIQLAVFIILMQGDALPGSVGTGFISLIFIIIITIFFTALMSGRMPKLFGYKIEHKEIEYAVLGYIFHFALVLTAIPIAIFALRMFNFSPGYGFTKLLWDIVSASVNNGSDFYGATGNINSLNILTGVLMLLGRYVPIYFMIKISDSLASKEISFTKTDLKIDSVYFSLSLVFFIFLLVIISILPLLALGPLSIG